MDTIVICSGGLDSVTLAHKTAAERRLAALSFDYGQRHVKEVGERARLRARLGVPHRVVDLRGVGAALSGSALTDDVDVPDGHYAEDTMKITIVPNRNAIMLAVAFGMAAAQKAGAVAAAVHGGDHFIYPDCRPGFIATRSRRCRTGARRRGRGGALDALCRRLQGRYRGRRRAPRRALRRDMVVLQGRARHCGRCGTCVERREAFHLAGVADPTEYDDPDFWRGDPSGGGVMYRITKEFHFSASHQLVGLPEGHPCAGCTGIITSWWSSLPPRI